MFVRGWFHLLAVGVLLAVSPPAGASHVVDFDEEVPWGCARRDCIPSIDEPRFSDGRWLADDDRVLGLEVNGDARAYPVRILNRHEIVNDVVGGVPVAVTYCPLCGTGLTFERTVFDEVTTFGVSGRLYKNDLVMYDRVSESHWSQALGEAIWGERHGLRLHFVPTATASWAEWREAHPDTRVLSRPDTYPEWQYDQYPYGDYESDPDTLFPVARPSNALHPKEWVLGVFTDNESVAYRKDDVERERVIQDRLDGRALIVTWVEGAPRARWAQDASADPYVSPQGSPDTGDAPRQILGFWFAWHDFHPETRLWGRLLASVILPREVGGVTRVVFSEAVDPGAIAPHVPPSVTARWLDERVLELSGSEAFTLPVGPYGKNGTALVEPLLIPLGRIESAHETPGVGAFATIFTGGVVAALAWILRRRGLRS